MTPQARLSARLETGDLDDIADEFYDYINNGLAAIGLDRTVNVWRKFTSAYPDARIISVGSGTGFLEYIFQKLTRVNFMTIDPAPLSFNAKGLREPFISPCFATVKDLLRLQMKNPVLFLNWCDPADNDFDYKAIKLLKPCAFLALFETADCEPSVGGAAGSFRFHSFLQKDHYRLVGEVNVPCVNGGTFHLSWYERGDWQLPAAWINDLLDAREPRRKQHFIKSEKMFDDLIRFTSMMAQRERAQSNKV